MIPRTPEPIATAAFVVLISLLFANLGNAADTAAFEFFEKQVRPLLVARCYQCHSGKKAGGGLSLETAQGWRTGGESGAAIVVGKPDQSLLIDAINYGSLEMPPPDAGGRLPADEIEILTRWVAMGAPDPRSPGDSLGGMSLEEAKSWWAFQPLPNVASLPTPEQIDQFLQRKHQQCGLTAAQPADKRTLIRRATYDLTGLPPTAEEVDAFLADDSAAAFDKVIDRLLESPQYGVRWGRHWLDIVRYADTAGENTDRPLPHAWRYRNWVLDAFNRDLPFDDFVRMQICGDIIMADGNEQQRAEGIIATGYLAVARRFGHDIDKDIHLMHEDVIDNIGKNFLGLTLGCARCHDHKYDPITASDYYALYGIFGSTRFSFPGCEPKGQPRDLVPLIDKAKVDALTAEYQKRLEDYERPMQVAAKESQRLGELAAKTSRILASATVGEGKSVSLHETAGGELDRIEMHQGDVLQLTVLPNDNHGADTTRIEWEIHKRGSGEQRWNVSDLIPRLTAGGPAILDQGATWCFLDVTKGPVFLADKKLNIQQKPSLSGWAKADLPSVTVNASSEPVSVWTTLPANAFFVHPGPKQDVSVAWVCPADGEYQVRGLVADAHPAGLDGVSFRFQHFTSAELGEGLIALGKLAAAAKPPRPAPPAIPVAYAVAEGKPMDARLQQRGDPEQLGDQIGRRWLSVFGGEKIASQSGSGRRELAGWIVEHPLFARVMVNRIWQWHFGRGLVATANDFGSRGEPPTHRELLDWLAAQFRSGGYRIKPLHRMIMKSAAYQRGKTAGALLAEQDPDNRWLARFSPRRLTAEEIRDSLLVASGQLDLSFGQAHPFPAAASWNYTQHNPFNAVYDNNRRSVFMMVQRQRRHPFLALFDGADPNSSTAARQSTTVPTQSLYFLNDPFFHQQAAGFVESIGDVADQATGVQRAFRRLLQRQPTANEMKIANRLLSQYPGETTEKWSAYARVLMATNEFLYVD